MSVFKCRGDKTAVGRWSFTPFTFLNEGVIERHFSTSVPTVSSMPAWLLDSCTITAIKAVQYRKPETDALNRLRTSRFGQTQFALPSASSPRGTTPEDGGRKACMLKDQKREKGPENKARARKSTATGGKQSRLHLHLRGHHLPNWRKLIVFNAVEAGCNRLPSCWWWMEPIGGVREGGRSEKVPSVEYE